MIVLTSSAPTLWVRRATSATASAAGSWASQAATSSSRRTIWRSVCVCSNAVVGLPSPTMASTAPELVAAAPFRHPGQLAREAAAVADAAPGRFILGLGSGWHEPEFTAFDLPFQRKVARLEEYLQLVKRLLAGERVSASGGFYSLRDASVLITAPAPPVWLAAFGPRMLQLTARHADGWNAAWLGADPERFLGLKDTLDGARGNRPITISVGVQVEPR